MPDRLWPVDEKIPAQFRLVMFLSAGKWYIGVCVNGRWFSDQSPSGPVTHWCELPEFVETEDGTHSVTLAIGERVIDTRTGHLGTVVNSTVRIGAVAVRWDPDENGGILTTAPTHTTQRHTPTPDPTPKHAIDLDELVRRLTKSEAVAKEVGDSEGTHAYCSWHGRADGLRYALQVIAEMRGVGMPVPEIDQDS